MTNHGREIIVDAFMRMKLRPQDADAHENPKIMQALQLQIRHFPSFALPDAENPVVICGFIHDFGVCTAWMVTGHGFEAAATDHVLPMQRQLCKTMYEVLNVHRMQIEVEAARTEAGRWATLLGFKYETTLARYSERGADVAMYLWPDERGKRDE